MSDKIQVANSVETAAKALRNMAELTANNTRNWDNFEAICKEILEQVANVK